VRWWGYGPPQSTFRLVVGDPVGTNFALMLVNCKSVSGPTAWRGQSLRITRGNLVGLLNYEWTVEDQNAGFRAEATSLHWARNVEVADPQAWLLWRPQPHGGVTLTHEQAEKLAHILDLFRQRPGMFVGKSDVLLATVFLMGFRCAVTRIFEFEDGDWNRTIVQRGWKLTGGTGDITQQMKDRGMSSEEIISELAEIEIDVLKQACSNRSELES
jgi:hypothetical protein